MNEDEVVSEALAMPPFNTGLLTTFAVLSLSLAVIGTYGAVQYSVVQRTREIGIRMAVGATRADMIHMILMYIGPFIALSIATGLLMHPFLPGCCPACCLWFGWWTQAHTWAYRCLLYTVAIIASLLTALRAASVDPMVALRDE